MEAPRELLMPTTTMHRMWDVSQLANSREKMRLDPAAGEGPRKQHGAVSAKEHGEDGWKTEIELCVVEAAAAMRELSTHKQESSLSGISLHCGRMNL